MDQYNGSIQQLSRPKNGGPQPAVLECGAAHLFRVRLLNNSTSPCMTACQQTGSLINVSAGFSMRCTTGLTGLNESASRGGREDAAESIPTARRDSHGATETLPARQYRHSFGDRNVGGCPAGFYFGSCAHCGAQQMQAANRTQPSAQRTEPTLTQSKKSQPKAGAANRNSSRSRRDRHKISPRRMAEACAVRSSPPQFLSSSLNKIFILFNRAYFSKCPPSIGRTGRIGRACPYGSALHTRQIKTVGAV